MNRTKLVLLVGACFITQHSLAAGGDSQDLPPKGSAQVGAPQGNALAVSSATLNFADLESLRFSLVAVVKKQLGIENLARFQLDLADPKSELQAYLRETLGLYTVERNSKNFDEQAFKRKVVTVVLSKYDPSLSNLASETPQPSVKPVYLLGLLPLAALGGGGGGGGGGTTSTAASGTSYYTEYAAQAGLAQVNALSLNDAGYTGSGVKLAIVDTGIDSSHSEFSGRTIQGTDFTSSAGGYSSDGDGHGTHVASIAAGNRDASGMRGVAYDASLYSYRIGNDAGTLTGVSTDASTASVFDRHVTDGIQVSNNSWGSTTLITAVTTASLNASIPLTIAAAQSAVSAGTIFVWAAGNAGAVQPSYQAGLPYRISGLSGQWLAVVAVDPNNVETAYTNRCGVAATWCVAAPGGGDTQSTDGIYAADAGTSTGYVRLSGTSMAAPHVSGVLTALIQKFPSLTSAQIVTRLTSTASLSGLTGYNGETLSSSGTAAMEAIFGYGLINSTDAMAKIGHWVLPNGKNYYSDGTYVVTTSSANLPLGLSPSTVNSIRSTDFVVFDSFDGANFSVKGSEIFGSAAKISQGRLGYIPSKHRQNGQRTTSLGTASFAHVPNSPIQFGYAESTEGSVSGGLSFWGDKLFLLPRMVTSGPSERRLVNEFGLALSDRTRANYFYEMTSDGTLRGYGFGLSHQPIKKLNVHFSVGSNYGPVHGFGYRSEVSSSNVYSIPKKFGAVYELTDSWGLFGYASYRSVKDFEATNEAWGLASGEYVSKAIGAEWQGLRGERIAFGLNQPEHLSRGSLQLVVPSGRLPDGTILWKNESFNVAGDVGPALFFAGRYPLSKIWGAEPEVRFQIQTDPLRNQSIDKATIEFSLGF